MTWIGVVALLFLGALLGEGLRLRYHEYRTKGVPWLVASLLAHVILPVVFVLLLCLAVRLC